MSKSRTAANSMFSEENDDKPNESNPNRGREIRSNNEPKTEDSSSSSIDSAGDKISQSKTNASTTIKDSSRILPSTTTNTDSESEQEEINTKATKNQTNISIPREENSRRVKHFRKLFQSEIKEPMPELIDSFVCAYQGDILLQGKMYITSRYLCFHSRIINYVTKHVHPWEKIEQVTKERVAFIFPTAIGIKLKRSERKIIYASFLLRDTAFDVIVNQMTLINGHANPSTRNTDETERRSINDNASLKFDKNSQKLKDRIQNESLEQDQVLQMCLVDNKTKLKRRQQKNSTRKLVNDSTSPISVNKSLNSSQPTNLLRNTNSIDENRLTNQPTSTKTSSLNQSGSTFQTDNAQTPSREQILSPSNSRLLTHTNSDSSSNISVPSQSTITNTYPMQWIINLIRFIPFFIISLIKTLMNYFLFLYDQFQTYPMKMSIILLISVFILIIHSCYLIKLAYRIEHRLQSLHHMWPSSKRFE